MLARDVVLKVPEPLYNALKARADEARRSVEAELLEMVASAVPEAISLEPELEHKIAQLAFLPDDSLWRVARSTLSRTASRRLSSLNLKQQREGLSEEEQVSLEKLVRQYEQAMLLRAEAARLLKERGFDIAPLLKR
jgi:hypothetical protein